MYGYMIHETGHHARSRIFEIGEASGLDAKHPILTLFNFIEDQGMEREQAMKYIGDRKALGKLTVQHVKKQVEACKDVPPEQFLDPEQIKSSSTYQVMLESRKDWDSYVEQAIDNVKTQDNSEIETLTNTLLREGWATKVQECDTPDISWDVSCDLYKRLYPEADPDQIEEIRKQGKRKNKGKEEEETGEGMPGTQPQPADSGEGGSKEGEESPSLIIYPWQLWATPEHGEDKQGIPAVIDWKGRISGKQVVLIDDSDMKIITCSTKGKSDYNLTTSNAASLANSIRIYIQATSKLKHTPEQYQGRVDKRALCRLVFPPIDGGDWNRRVFYTTTNKKYKNTAIAILTDWSGSMIGRKKKIAVRATSKLTEVFDKQLRVPTLVTAFSGATGRGVVGIIKNFDDKSITSSSIGSGFTHFDKYTAGNTDADAILWVYKQLKKRREERKILLVLSDGAPTDCHRLANPDDMLIHTTKALESKQDLDLIGIGIVSSAVKRYYKNYKVIEDVEELDKVLLEVLKDIYTQ